MSTIGSIVMGKGIGSGGETEEVGDGEIREKGAAWWRQRRVCPGFLEAVMGGDDDGRWRRGGAARFTGVRGVRRADGALRWLPNGSTLGLMVVGRSREACDWRRRWVEVAFIGIVGRWRRVEMEKTMEEEGGQCWIGDRSSVMPNGDDGEGLMEMRDEREEDGGLGGKVLHGFGEVSGT